MSDTARLPSLTPSRFVGWKCLPAAADGAPGLRIRRRGSLLRAMSVARRCRQLRAGTG
jgi:hypothetical protein